jgi:hypothetical protein
MIRRIKGAMLGERTIIRSHDNLPTKSAPIERPWRKLLENPELLKGQRTLFGGEIESPDVKIRKMEMLMRRDYFLDGEDDGMAKEVEKKKPTEFFREGAVSVSVWDNDGTKGKFKTFSLTRSYKKGDTWAYTTSLGTRDLPNAIKALQTAMDKYGEKS